MNLRIWKTFALQLKKLDQYFILMQTHRFMYLFFMKLNLGKLIHEIHRWRVKTINCIIAYVLPMLISAYPLCNVFYTSNTRLRYSSVCTCKRCYQSHYLPR